MIVIKSLFPKEKRSSITPLSSGRFRGFLASDPKALYGATMGVAFVNGIAAERFAVRQVVGLGVTLVDTDDLGDLKRGDPRNRGKTPGDFWRPMLIEKPSQKISLASFFSQKTSIQQVGGWRTILLR